MLLNIHNSEDTLIIVGVVNTVGGIMNRSREFADKKILPLNKPAVCNICSQKKNDVLKIRKNWFSSINICDSCGYWLFRKFRKDIGGKSENKSNRR